jgi:hypothetical protein
MKRECAWCGQDLGNSIHLDEKGVTYGICLSCSEIMLAESKLACEQENLLQEKAEDTQLARLSPCR